MSRNPFSKEPNPFADPSVTQHTADQDNGGYDVPAATGGGAWGAGGGGAWSADPPQAKPAAKSPKSPKMPDNGSTPQADKGAHIAPRSFGESVTTTPPTVPQRPAAASTAKNFPACYPMVYHDIDAEIPESMRFLIRMALYSYMLFLVTLLYNFFSVLLSIGSDEFKITAIFFSAIYMVVGPPAAWMLWYRRIYNAAAKDRAITYMCFFLDYAVHVGFCGWAALAPPIGIDSGKSFSGIFTMAKMFGDSVWRGVIFLIGFVLWLACTLMGVWLWSQMMRAFRNQGGMQQAQTEAKTAVGRAAVSQAGRV